jgi:hypothetical protein
MARRERPDGNEANRAPERTEGDEAPRTLARATVTNPLNSPDMKDYPFLFWGPRADPKARVASSGTPLEDILAVREKYPEMPQDGLAAWFKLSPEETEEVLRWADDPEAPGRST